MTYPSITSALQSSHLNPWPRLATAVLLSCIQLGTAFAAGLDITADELTRSKDGTIIAKGDVIIEQRPFRQLESIELFEQPPRALLSIVIKGEKKPKHEQRELRFSKQNGAWLIVSDAPVTPSTSQKPPATLADRKVGGAWLALIEEWKNSWNRRDKEAHIALYAPNAYPTEFVSREAWLQALDKVFTAPPVRRLAADEVRYHPNNRRMQASGHVRIDTAEGRIEAETADVDGQSQLGTLKNATLYLPDGGRFHAREARRIAEHRYIADHVTFSQCPEDEEAWRVRAKQAWLDDEHGILEARNAAFDWLGFTPLYTPYWRQAYKRQSGLLLPDFGYSKRRGTEVAVPLYLAPAQDWDFTFTPRWMSARGIMLSNELRHAASFGRGELRIEGLNDTLTGTKRGRIDGDIAWSLPLDIRFLASGEHVTDNDYLADFDRTGHSSERFLSSQASLSQALPHFNWTLLALHQQDLTQTSNARVAQILPRLETQAQSTAGPHLSLHFDHQSTHFVRAKGSQGWRIDLHPYLESPWELADGSIQLLGHIGIRSTHYRLTDTRLTQRRLVHVAPEASLETRLTLERISQDGAYRHTITPTLRYDWVKPPDQTDDPKFDSSFGNLTWSNLLSANRFSGLDRIEDANRLTLMIENSLQHKEGISNRDLFMAGIGASYNFSRRRIDLKLQKNPIRPISNLLGLMEWNPIEELKFSAEVQYNPYGRYVATTKLAAGWHNEVGQASIGYRETDKRYARPARLLDIRGTMNVGSSWQVDGAFQYDTLIKLTQQAAAGIQYKHACWSIKVEGYRINRQSGTTNSANTGFHILLEFKGLGSVGS
ncbi:MAG: LPS-assembly protein LptD [Zetaproteobacteria bacterium]|nr:MAG: LPS-assembly protein LptD [Zetaproteobacteria bacterium]